MYSTAPAALSSLTNEWLTPVLSLSLMLFAYGNALRGRKMVSRIRSFNDRFSSWQFQGQLFNPL
ncbi:hypothetical protein F3P66_25270 (plasmid) [Agrobacterium fabrum]|nr:hypothetical protein F3P66_25270 [Agrobacterium fabrum]TRB28148.1 hypothetical protein EXN51_15960 [Agrobacterium fabrum]